MELPVDEVSGEGKIEQDDLVDVVRPPQITVVPVLDQLLPSLACVAGALALVGKRYGLDGLVLSLQAGWPSSACPGRHSKNIPNCGSAAVQLRGCGR